MSSEVIPSPFAFAGLDDMISEKIFSYLDGPDFIRASLVSKTWRKFIKKLIKSRRKGRIILNRIDGFFHEKWLEGKFKHHEISRNMHFPRKRCRTFQDPDVIIYVERRDIFSRKGVEFLDILRKKACNKSLAGHTVTVSLTPAPKGIPKTSVKLLGMNVEFYGPLVFLLCIERSLEDKNSVKLVLQARDKLRGTLVSSSVLKIRSSKSDPSFSQAMIDGQVIAALPGSRKLAIAKEPFVVSIFSVGNQANLTEMYKIRIPHFANEPHIMLSADYTLLAISNYSATYVYETAGHDVDHFATMTMPQIVWGENLEKMIRFKLSQKFIFFQVENQICGTSELGIMEFEKNLNREEGQQQPQRHQPRQPQLQQQPRQQRQPARANSCPMISWLTLKTSHRFDNIFDVSGSRLLSVQSFEVNRAAIWLSDLEALSNAFKSNPIVAMPSERLVVLEPNEAVTCVFMTKATIAYDTLAVHAFCSDICETYRTVIRPESLVEESELGDEDQN